MLSGLTVAVIGEMLGALKSFASCHSKDAKVFLVGFDQLDHGFIGAEKLKMSELPFEQVDSMILPVSGATDEGIVATVFSNEKVVLEAKYLERTLHIVPCTQVFLICT